MFDHPTIDALGAFLETRLGLSSPAARPGIAAMSSSSQTADSPILDANDVAAMSEEDIERLLLERLENDR